MYRMFSNCWVNIWNKYLISWCVKNKLVSSANNFGSNVFEAFFKSFTYKRNRSGPKIEPRGNRSWSSLSLFFLFHWLDWIFSYFRGSSWLIHDFYPLYHIVPIYWEQWGSLQCKKPSIGQWVHKVYICYFQRFNSGLDKFLYRRLIFRGRNFICAPNRAREKMDAQNQRARLIETKVNKFLFVLYYLHSTCSFHF